MKRIFSYIDYRVFLADFYNHKKQTTRYFSYRYFAQHSDIKSPAFLKEVIDGKRNLTPPMIDKFAKSLDLNKKESLFFRNLVLFNQARTANEKQEHYSVLLSMGDYVQEFQLSADHFSYFESWYHSIIRELVCLHDFKDNFSLLGKAVRPAISTRDAEKSVQLLLRLKLLVKQPDGTYAQSNQAIVSNDEMVALARRSFNSAMLERAKEANESLPTTKRNISSMTLGISPVCYDVLLTELAAFKERVKTIVTRDEHSSQVYQFNFQLFPISEDVGVMENKAQGPLS